MPSKPIAPSKRITRLPNLAVQPALARLGRTARVKDGRVAPALPVTVNISSLSYFLKLRDTARANEQLLLCALEVVKTRRGQRNINRRYFLEDSADRARWNACKHEREADLIAEGRE